MKKNSKILIVDDEKFSRELTRKILGNLGYEIFDVSSGEEAVEFLSRDSTIDLILLDLLMVGMDGYDVLREIKQNPATKEIKVIIMSALDDEDEQKQAIRLGALDFIKKPVNAQELISTLQNLF
jgi:CheY-like chemotaxis protein